MRELFLLGVRSRCVSRPMLCFTTALPGLRLMHLESPGAAGGMLLEQLRFTEMDGSVRSTVSLSGN